MSCHRTIIRLSAVLAVVALAKGCGDGESPSAPPTPEPARPTTVTVSPATHELTALGQTIQLTAEVRDQNARVMAGATVTWTSSASSVATVDASGLVTAAGNGTATITASAESASGSAVVTVMQSVASVEVSPSVDELTALGQTVQLTAEAFDENGHAVAGAEFSWESSDAAVATVDAGGLVTAVAEGVATITASAGEASGSAVVTVMQPVASVEVSPSAEMIGLGSTLQLTAEAFDENGEAVAGVEFSWESSDAAIATVDAGGLVTGVAVGTATITASVGGAQGTAEITVGPNPDRAALVALYEATDGQNWVNSENWLTDEPLDRWYGIRMGSYGRVTRLHLSENALSGPIPPELGELTHLTVLALFRNQLGGKIPPELGELTRLTELILSGNQLSGPIPPELGNLTDLTWLSVGKNQLSGAIPPELGNLANLEHLGLEQNLLSGPVPPELGNLVKLTWLALVVNKLSGPLPRSLLQLKRLQWLTVRGNATLCVPGTSSFITWLRGIDQQDGDRAFCNAADRVALTSLYDSGGGSSWTNSDGWLGDGALSQWHGITADLVGRVVRLDLTRNGLAGGLPANLGQLASMTNLRIGDNALSGRLPLSLARLPLQELRFADTELCAPTEESFQAWLNAISVVEGTGVRCAPVSDRDILEALYAAAGGPNWTNNRNWLSGTPLRNWYGVSVDARGRVTGLNLSSNNLSGPIPAELGSLANLTSLDLGSNNLSGPIPSELGQLANLTTLQLARNNLSGPIPPQLGNLTNLHTLEAFLTQLSGSIPPELGNLTNLSTLQLFGNLHVGEIPPELGNLASLRVLELAGNSLTGPIPSELGNLANLRRLSLSSSGLSGPIPPELGRLARLEALRLARNDLTGSIPSELGNLASLTELELFRNNLSGPIPPELGNLVNLTQINLFNNALSGSIPVTLGRLVNVRGFRLSDNGLTGPIPPELGGLSSVETLWLNGNGLSGAIPPEVGDLSSITYLGLHGNALTGPIPPELGNLSTLEQMFLSDNDLSGALPPELAGMSSLQELGLSNNHRMEGPLPLNLTALRQLTALLAGDTGLCAPSDPGFQAWLAGVYRRRLARCIEGDAPMAYLTQTVQSSEFPVPLVAGERALLRVFATARRATNATIPAVRARFFINGTETHVEDIPGKSTPIPTGVDEGSLAKSANAEIPGGVIQPGLEMVIEIDPQGTLDDALGVAKRIPETGRLAVDVRAMPVFDLTLVPFISTDRHDLSIVDLTRAMAADPERHEMLRHTRTLLPVGELEVTAHEPVLTSAPWPGALLAQTAAIRAMEGGTGHYLGMMPPPAGGVSQRPGRSSFAQAEPGVIAHELGHAMGLYHAPCGDAEGPDPSFPYMDGSIGAWGYDFRDGRLVNPYTKDLMGYCGYEWISDYSFTNALRFRLSDEGPPSAAAVAAASLLLWGGVGTQGEPFLEPAFVLGAPPTLPDSAGEYRVTGRTASGGELFSLSFAMPEVAHGDGSSSFAFVLPARPGWAGALASITLSGPGGSVTVDGESDLPMAILRNPRTGQVRGILRDLPPATQAARDAAGRTAGPGLEVLISRGIPDAAAWRR